MTLKFKVSYNFHMSQNRLSTIQQCKNNAYLFSTLEKIMDNRLEEIHTSDFKNVLKYHTRLQQASLVANSCK